MPNILPNAQFQFLADQRNKEFASSQQNQQVMQDNFKRAALTNQFNQAYKQYEQDKDVNKFEQNVRSLGMTYGNDKMASFKAQDSRAMKGIYQYDASTGKATQTDSIPKDSVIKDSPAGKSKLSVDKRFQGRALARKLYGVRGAEKGLPDIMEAMEQGIGIDEIEDKIRMGRQSEGFSGEVRNAAQSIYMNTSSGISEKAMDYIDDYIQTGDMEGAKNQLKKAAKDTSGTEQKKNIMGKDRTVEFLGEIQDDLNELEQRGVNTNIFTGSVEEINKKVGRVNDPALRKVATKIKVAIQTYRRSMSGVAFSVPESQEYADMFPSIGRTQNFNTANISALREVISGDLENFYSRSMGQDNYNKLFNTQASQMPQQGQMQGNQGQQGQLNPDVMQKINMARQSGYSDEEIQAYLGGQ